MNLVDSKRVAEYLCVSVKFVEKHREHMFGSVKFGGVWRFDIEQIQKRIASGKDIILNKERSKCSNLTKSELRAKKLERDNLINSLGTCKVAKGVKIQEALVRIGKNKEKYSAIQMKQIISRIQNGETYAAYE